MRTILLAVLFLIPIFSLAQKQPALSLGEVPQIRLPELDNEALKAKEKERRQTGAIPAFAETHPTNISPEAHGIWTYAKSGTATWRLRIYSKGAKSLNFGFTQYFMPEGGELLLYTPDRKVVKGPFSVSENNSDKQLWTPIVAGEEVVLEVQLPLEKKEELELHLSAVNHDFMGFESLLSQRCNLDVNCGTEDGWDIINPYRDIIKSVGLYSLNGRLSCTGFLVNNARQDCTPYYMTAAHCGVTARNAASLVVYWNFENSTCRPVNSALSGQNGDGNLEQFNTGARLIADNGASDMTLLQLNTPVADSVGAFYAGWNNSPMAPDTVISIHHPSTDEKRISFSYQKTAIGRREGIVEETGQFIIVPNWDVGTTEGGSSGGPLFNTAGEVVGQLFGGLASCNNPEFDSYGRIFNSWEGNETPDTRLKDWLDPEGLGLTRLKGMYKTDCDRQIRPSVFQELICARDTASYLLNLDAGLDDSITLSLRNLPDSIPFSFQRVDSQQIELLIFDASALINQARIFQVIASDSSFQTEVNLKLTVLSDSLSAVDLLLPEDESPSVSTSPTFSWLANSPELRYRFQLSTDSTFSTIALDSSGLSNEFLNVSDLVPSSNYYWRVRASSPCSEGEWSDVFSLTTASCRTYRSSDVPVNISAGGPRSYTSDLVVEEQGNIADVNVIALKGIHTWISDLQFDLVSPSGTRVTLMDRICLDERNFDIQFDDEAEAARLPCPPSDGLVYQPSGSLSSFEGEFTKGTWQLSFRDHQAQDGGQLQEWGIELCEVSKQFDIAVLLSQDSFLLCEEDSINLSVEIGTDFELAGLSIFLESAPGLITSSITPSEENDRMGIIALSQLDLLSDGIYNIAVVVDDGTFVSRANLRLEILSLPAVNLVRPENGTTALKVDEGLFEWNGIGQIDRYELLVATDSLFSNIVYQETSSNTFFGTGDSLLSNQNYYWQVRAQNKCGEVQSDLFQFLTETVVASKNIFSFDYKIYPNPTGDVLWIELEPSDAQLELYSNDGRLLMHRHFKERMNLDLSSYPSGIYQLRLVTKKGSVVEKVVKE